MFSLISQLPQLPLHITFAIKSNILIFRVSNLSLFLCVNCVIDSNLLAKVNQIKYHCFAVFTTFTIIYHHWCIIGFLLFKQFVLNKYFVENADYFAVLLLFSLAWLMLIVFCANLETKSKLQTFKAEKIFENSWTKWS